MIASRSLRIVLDRHLAAHDDRAAAEMIGGADALTAQDDAAGREIRTGNDVHEFVDASAGSSISAMQASITSPRLCGGMLVAMPTAMPPAPLTSRFGKLRRQNRRLAFRVVVVRLEVDGVLVDVVEQRMRDLGQPRFGVAHRRGHIAVDRAEIALPVDQRQAHREVLRHAHQRVVDRLIAVRMIFTHHVADDARRLAVRLVPLETVLVHRVENAAMHRLQAVAHIRQRARHDDAHGVIEVGAFHLIEDGNGTNIRGRRRLPGVVIFGVGQGWIPSGSNQESYSAGGVEKPPSTLRESPFFLLFSQLLTGRCSRPAGRRLNPPPDARDPRALPGGIAAAMTSRSRLQQAI